MSASEWEERFHQRRRPMSPSISPSLSSRNLRQQISGTQSTSGAQPCWVPGRCAPGMTGALRPADLLAAQWLTFLHLLVEAARRFVRLKHAGARGADARAEAFELQLRCLLVVLARKIDQCPEEAPETRRTLCFVYRLLTVLAMFATKLRAELAEISRSAQWMRINAIPRSSCCKTTNEYRCNGPALQLGPRGYLDSS